MFAFSIWEISTKGPTLIPMSVFLNLSTSILYLGSFFHGVVLFSLVYYMPEFFQAVMGYTPLIAGVAALPQTATVVPCAMVVGIVVGKTGKYRWAVWLGWVLTTFGMGLLIYLKTNTSVPAWIFLEIVSGIGIGLLFPSIALAIQASTPSRDVAMTSTLALWFRSLGQTLGVAIGGTIFQNRLKTELANVPGFSSTASTEANNAVGLIEYLRHLPSGDPQATALKQAYTRSFRAIWTVMCILAGISMLLSFFVKEYSMEQEHMTEQGFRDAEDIPVREETKSSNR